MSPRRHHTTHAALQGMLSPIARHQAGTRPGTGMRTGPEPQKGEMSLCTNPAVSLSRGCGCRQAWPWAGHIPSTVFQRVGSLTAGALGLQVDSRRASSQKSRDTIPLFGAASRPRRSRGAGLALRGQGRAGDHLCLRAWVITPVPGVRARPTWQAIRSL